MFFAFLMGCLVSFAFFVGSSLMRKTQTKNGRGTSNEVNYSNSLQVDGLSCTYECRIHAWFLDVEDKQFSSDLFTFAGRMWSLRVYNKDGHTSFFLKLVSGECVDAHYRFTLINHQDSTKNIVNGWRHMFKPGSSFGRANVKPTLSIADPDAGYLLGDCFMVEVKIVIIPPENRNLVLDVSRTYTVTWKLRCLKEIGLVDIYSDDIAVENATWNLNLETGESAKDGTTLGVFLYCKTDHPIKTKFSITLVNHRDNQRSIAKGSAHTFAADRQVWGWFNFVQMSKLRDLTSGFLDDEWLTLIVRFLCSDAEELDVHLSERQISRATDTTVSTNRSTQSMIERECVVCHDAEQTSGFAHGETSHKCVCADCCRKLRAAKRKCPICNAEVDCFIVNYF